MNRRLGAAKKMEAVVSLVGLAWRAFIQHDSSIAHTHEYSFACDVTSRASPFQLFDTVRRAFKSLYIALLPPDTLLCVLRAFDRDLDHLRIILHLLSI
jgi:hypothetical protein